MTCEGKVLVFREFLRQLLLMAKVRFSNIEKTSVSLARLDQIKINQVHHGQVAKCLWHMTHDPFHTSDCYLLLSSSVRCLAVKLVLRE